MFRNMPSCALMPLDPCKLRTVWGVCLAGGTARTGGRNELMAQRLLV